MHRYGYAGHVLVSAVQLPELAAEPVMANAPRWTCGPGIIDAPRREWARSVGRDEEGRVTRHVIAAPGGGWIIEFTAGARFHISADSITWSAPAAMSAETVRHLLLDHALPLALSTGPDLVLHGSCVALDGAVAAFLGPSGTGKSTLAAACHARGLPVVGDDCVIVSADPAQQWTVAPVYGGLRLWPEATHRYLPDAPSLRMEPGSAKLRVALPPQGGARPLGRLYVLERGGPTASVAIQDAGASGAMDVLHNEFRLDLHDRALLAHHFDLVCAMTRAGAVRRLTVPGSLETIDVAIDAVVADLAAAVVERCA
jgi:hypothetical protein